MTWLPGRVPRTSHLDPNGSTELQRLWNVLGGWRFLSVSIAALAVALGLLGGPSPRAQSKPERLGKGSRLIRASKAQKAPAPGMSSEYPVYGPLLRRSIASQANDQPAVEAFVEEVFRQTGFATTTKALKNRVVRTEMAYRAGKMESIPVATLVREYNAAIHDATLPEFFVTSEAQIAVQKLFVQAHTTRGLWDDDDDPSSVTPSEATFLSLFLTYQKIFNPTYQVLPDVWASRQRALIAKKPPEAFLKARASAPVKRFMALEYSAMTTELAKDTGPVTQRAHDLFDRLGFSR